MTFDTAQPQWLKVLDKFKDITVVPMRDMLEFQACVDGQIDSELLQFCVELEQIQTHHDNPRQFLFGWLSLYNQSLVVFKDNAIRNKITKIMVSDEWFDLIRWFDKEYKTFDEE